MMANGVRNVKTGQFYPFLVSAATVAAKVNRRYFVRDIHLGYHRTGVQAADTTALSSQLNNVSVVLATTSAAQMTQASDYQDDDVFVTVGLLLDKEKDLTVTGTPTVIKITYAEVDDLA
jgi:hypothetical protein